jgi:hypothetical protein
MKKVLTCLSIAFAFLIFTFMVQPAFASGDLKVQNTNGTMYLTTESTTATVSTVATTTNKTGRLMSDIHLPNGFFSDTGILINKALQILLVISTLLVFANLIIGAFEWITSGGDKGKVDKARQRMVNSIIGLVILVSSYAILLLIIRFLGYRDLNDIINNAYQFNLESAPTATSSSSLQPLITK